MKQIYIIEHLEPSLFKWCLIEYKNISKIVGKSNLWFTNIKRESKASRELKKYGKVFEQSVKGMKLKDACVLDPEAKETLTPKNSKACRYFIFGGILGDYPPRKRTKKELTKFIENVKSYDIGKKQFSTDNAVFVVHEIANGTKLQDMEFQNKLEIKTGKYESMILPYLYPLVKGKPNISPELVKLIERKKGF
jgi:ribosome biogenesis SPOUT family RNA methylase Rps3